MALGAYASQATTANKPTLRRGITNQQLYSIVSSGIGNSTYAGGSTGTGVTPTITPNYGADPFGGNTACRVQLSLNGGTTTADRAYLSATSAPLDLAPRTSATWVRTVSGTATLLTRYNGNTLYYTVDTNWQLIWVVGNSNTDPTHNVVEIRGGQSTTNSNTADLLVATHGVFLGVLTAQQVLQCGGIPLTTTSAASSTAGNWAWQGNGTSNQMSLPGPILSFTDDCVVVTGARLDTQTGGGYFCILAPASNSGTAARAGLLGVAPSNLASVYWTNDAGTFYVSNVGTVTPGVPFVLSGVQRAGSVKGRLNGGAWANTVNPTGAASLNTGGVMGASGLNVWGGSVYLGCAVKGVFSDTDLLAIERMVAVFTGPFPGMVNF